MVALRTLRTDDVPQHRLAQIRTLLLSAFGGTFAEEDWAHAHALGGRHVIASEDHVVAHAAVVERTLGVGDRVWRCGYVEGVATAPGRQGEGLGSLVMRQVGELVRAEFDLGALSTDRHGFYERLGWERWRGPSFVHNGRQVIRTPDEDDGIMVLRFGATAELDLTDAIWCESRPGDDW
jgi:aminoglycoside 2'-N-acetyltransferase I